MRRATPRSSISSSPGSDGSQPVDELLDTQFGSCNFDELTTTPPPDSGGGLRIIPARCRSHEQEPTKPGRISAMVAFTLSCSALLMFFWVSFGGTLPLRPKGYRFTAAFPEARCW